MSKNPDTIQTAEIRAAGELPISSKKIRKHEKESRAEQKILSLNAWHLARYLVEHEKLPENLDVGEFMVMAENYPNLSDEKKALFVNQYAQLEFAAGSVTARTLYATRIHGKTFISAVTGTSVGQYLLALSAITTFFVSLLFINTTYLTNDALIFFNNVDPSWWMLYFAVSNKMLPFFAAGLGACVYLLRVTQEKLQSREFDPAWIPSHLIRLGLGTLAGGTIVFFPELLDHLTGQTANTNDPTHTLNYGLGYGLVAFIFGYAVDIYYKVLDRIGGEIGTATAKQKAGK